MVYLHDMGLKEDANLCFELVLEINPEDELAAQYLSGDGARTVTEGSDETKDTVQENAAVADTIIGVLSPVDDDADEKFWTKVCWIRRGRPHRSACGSIAAEFDADSVSPEEGEAIAGVVVDDELTADIRCGQLRLRMRGLKPEFSLLIATNPRTSTSTRARTAA